MLRSSLQRVGNRAILITTLLCYGGAALLAVFAVFTFVQPNRGYAPAWILLAGGALLAAGGVNSQNALRQLQDMSRQAESEAVLAQAQLERQRSAVDSLADGLEVGIFICDSRAAILYANRRAMELFRFEDPIGRSILAITLSYDLEQLVMEAFRIRQPQHAELSFAYPTERVGMAKAWPSDDNAERVFLSIYEITDLRRLERIRQDFVSNVSHELRTPLTIIRSMAETLLDDATPDPELSAKYLPKIVSEVDRLSMISNDLLILSAAESNPVRKHNANIAEVFRGTLEQLAGKAREKGLEVEYDGPPRLIVEANTSQMTQVAMNLIDNAINYTNQGKITVTVAEEGSDALVMVRDTGLGIASEHLPRIFERFYRVDKARSRVSGGTGLGLSIVKHIVESHGGKVTVESALNQGSVFQVRIPIGDPTPAEE